MFTLKLYQNDPVGPGGRTTILECCGIWVDYLAAGVKHVRAFKKTVGVMDEDGGHEFYVGGNPTEAQTTAETGDSPPPAIIKGAGGNHYSWGVLENALGKTTEMLR